MVAKCVAGADGICIGYCERDGNEVGEVWAGCRGLIGNLG